MLTPPDPISQISLAIPIILLYEVSIISVRMVEKRRKQRDDESDAAAGVGEGDADEPVEDTDFNLGR